MTLEQARALLAAFSDDAYVDHLERAVWRLTAELSGWDDDPSEEFTTFVGAVKALQRPGKPDGWREE